MGAFGVVMNDEIMPITPPKISRGRAISLGKLRAKIMRLSGVNYDLLGEYQKCPKCHALKYGGGKLYAHCECDS